MLLDYHSHHPQMLSLLTVDDGCKNDALPPSFTLSSRDQDQELHSTQDLQNPKLPKGTSWKIVLGEL